MFKAKEILILIFGIIILAFVVNFNNITKLQLNQTQILTALIFMAIIVFVNVIAKKLAAYYYDSHIEIKIWNVERYGLSSSMHFKRPVPAGIILPFFISLYCIHLYKKTSTMI
jgi:uncharacterized membrane protein